MPHLSIKSGPYFKKNGLQIFFFCHTPWHVGPSFPNQESHPALASKVLNTGPPGKFQNGYFKKQSVSRPKNTAQDTIKQIYLEPIRH